MYVILVYDINLEEKAGQKVLRNVYKTCKKYLVHIQNSVFEGELLESQAVKLKKELDKYIREDQDSVILFKSRNQKWLDKEFLGMKEDDKTSNFLWKKLSTPNPAKIPVHRQIQKNLKISISQKKYFKKTK